MRGACRLQGKPCTAQLTCSMHTSACLTASPRPSPAAVGIETEGQSLAGRRTRRFSRRPASSPRRSLCCST